MKFKRITSKIKKSTLAIALAVFMSFSTMSGLVVGLNKIGTVYAYNQEVSQLISNNNFSSDNTHESTKPSTPNNWKSITDTNSIPSTVKYGVINTHSLIFDSYNTEYHDLNESDTTIGTTFTSDLSQGQFPSKDNAVYKHLFINSKDTPQSLGFESSSITLSKASFYTISFYVRTINSARASVYLKGLSNEDTISHIQNISSPAWDKFEIYIATNEFVDETVTVQFWLGSESTPSKGAAFLNKVEVWQHSSDMFEYQINNNTAQYKHILIDLNNEQPSYRPFDNANFDIVSVNDGNKVHGFKTISTPQTSSNHHLDIINVETNSAVLPSSSITHPGTNNVSTTKNALLMYSEFEDALGVRSTGKIEILPNQLYKVKVWAKSKSNETTPPTIKLVELDDKDEIKTSSDPISVSTSSSSASTVHNGWTEYAFFVEGHSNETKYLNLEIWLGTNETKAKGYVFIADISVKNINYSQLESSTESATITKMSFNNTNIQYLVPNGNFDLINNKNTTVQYPLTPRDWKLSTTDENFNLEKEAISGVVDTKTSEWNEFISKLDEITNQNLSISNP